MAALARRSRHKKQAISKNGEYLIALVRALLFIIFAAASTAIAQDLLSPVYGGIPSSLYYELGIVSFSLLAITTAIIIPDHFRKLHVWLPVLAFYAPLAQSWLSGYSSVLGPIYGPMITYCVTWYPFLFLSILSSATHIKAAKFGVILSFLLGLGSFFIFNFIRAAMLKYKEDNIGNQTALTRISLQYLLATCAGVASPSPLLLLNIPSLLHLMFIDIHGPFLGSQQRANTALAAVSPYKILARRESVTGYVSVLENTKTNFRLMRCDHSLLGGEWLQSPVGKPNGLKTREPVFAVFVMLEAVRLIESLPTSEKGKEATTSSTMEPEPSDDPSINGEVVEEFPAEDAPDDYWNLKPSDRAKVDDPEQQIKYESTTSSENVPEPTSGSINATTEADTKYALIIGLGIGTAAKAMISHGVLTTIIEIDPVVHTMATEFFELPSDHKAVIADAKPVIARAALDKAKFHYIIHDVFTGGAVPASLFTYEVFRNLRRLLTSNGAISINYAGDIEQPEARLLVQTIRRVFPVCRIYREMAAPTPEEVEEQGYDMTNMVIFCVKNDKPFKFRKPKESDFLESEVRRGNLIPKHEILDGAFAYDKTNGTVLRDGDEHLLRKWQEKSAVAHWHVMRQVIANPVWELW
jgi:spermidine synthase